jgi:hypothetical protein
MQEEETKTTTAIKIKRKKVNELRPPVAIREKTKERRAWLASEVERVNKIPGLEAKIVDVGTYQTVSVWEVTGVVGRKRFRGICQFCGNSQVVSSGLIILVLHGYKRPGDGQIWGRCPGVDLQPLNIDDSHTLAWLRDSNTSLLEAKIRLGETAVAFKTARDAAFGPHASLSNSERAAGIVLRPSRKIWEDEAQYKIAYTLWAKKFPVVASYYETSKADQQARQTLWQAEQNVAHFQGLVDAKIYGTELAEEIV